MEVIKNLKNQIKIYKGISLVLLIILIFIIYQIVFAAPPSTPNPGHPLNETGGTTDGSTQATPGAVMFLSDPSALLTLNTKFFWDNTLLNLGIGVGTPTASLHLKTSSGAISTAPIKFTEGTNLGTEEAGAMEWDGTNLFITQTSGPTRKTIAYTSDITGSTGWDLTGNASTVDGTNFIGTTDNIPFNIKVNNEKAGRIDNTLSNAFFGYQAGNANTFAKQNVAIGDGALYRQSYANGDSAWATDNTAVGFHALYANEPTAANNGRRNVAVGSGALASNTIGQSNTAIGFNVLATNTIGVSNVANGTVSLTANTTAGQNVAIGVGALQTQSYDNGGSVYNSGNVAIGFQALNKNQPTSSTEGIQNIALGTQALYSNTTGSANTASGYQSLYSNTTGAKNTAFGMNTLYTNSTGTGNVALGYNAGKYETGSDAFYVDNKDRTDTAGDKAGALLYGTFNATPASQTLKINAIVETLGNIEFGHASDTTLARSGAGDITIEGNTVYRAGGTDVAVTDGGTGKSSWIQYLIPYADTTTSFSQIAIGNAGEVLTSNGAGSAPSFQTSTSKSVWSGYSSASLNADAVCAPSGYSVCSTTVTAAIGEVLPVAATIKNIYARISTAPSGHSCIFTIRESTTCAASSYVATDVTCTIASGETSCLSATTDTIAAGNCLQIHFDENTACSGNLWYGFEIDF